MANLKLAAAFYVCVVNPEVLHMYKCMYAVSILKYIVVLVNRASLPIFMALLQCF